MSIEKIKRLTMPDAVEPLIALISCIPSLIARNRVFVFAFVMTVIFYLPALRNGSIDAGFLYKGDMLGWYLPALAKTHSLLHSLNFTAIDYSTFNGSSDFFLSPNFFAYHPLVVIYCLLFSPENAGVQQLGQFLVLLMAIHSFLACYFSLKLLIRFFAFEFLTAALVATVFAFGFQMINALGQPPFLICASIVPWAIYAALVYADKQSLRNLIIACLPIMIGFLGGYMPLGVACLALSAFFVATKILYIDETAVPFEKRLQSVFVAYLPYVCSSIIVGPYLYSVYKFHQETSSVGSTSLFYSAHELAQSPQSLLYFFSAHLAVPGRVIEFTLTSGFIVVAIAIVFFFSQKAVSALTSSEVKLFKTAVIIYVMTVLSIFGDYSAVSDLVYYLIPQVGSMHLYERFLLPAQLLIGFIVALMLKSVVRERSPITTRVTFAVFAAVTIVFACLVAYKPDFAKGVGLNNYLVFEMFLGAIFSLCMILPGNKFIYLAAIFLIFLSPLDRMYDDSIGPSNTLTEQRKVQPFSLDGEMRNRIVEYFKQHSDKAVIKYVDITPMWSPGTVSSFNATGTYEIFPKVFPDYVLNQLKLSSYGGFTFYLSARADYMRKMPVEGDAIAVNPDWNYLRNTGADFLVAQEWDLQSGALGSIFAKTRTQDVLRLPNNVIILPLLGQSEKLTSHESGIFDNGYLKISPTNNIESNTLVNIALGKVARQSSDAGAEAKRAVDGNTDGEFSHGSASHTLRDVNAWFEVDLGSVEPIDNVTIWNRTDCCGYCLRDFWLFISNQPFKATDTASDLSTRAGTWGQQNFAPNPKGTIMTDGVTGRYVRVQLPGGTKTLKECFLSLAELQVFRSSKSHVTTAGPSPSTASGLKVNKFDTDNASFLSIDFESSVPTSVQYLFWNNPRLNYYLNGVRVKMADKDGLSGLEVPAGSNRIDIKYKHWPLIIFWIFYGLYAVLLMWVLVIFNPRIINAGRNIIRYGFLK